MRKYLLLLTLIFAAFSATQAQFKGGYGDGYDSDTSAFALPAPGISSNSPICSGTINDTIKLFAPTISGATYAWTGPNGFTSSLEDPIILNAMVNMTGNYNLSITVGTVTSPTSTHLVEVDSFPKNIAIPSGLTTVCTGTPQTAYISSSQYATQFIWQVIPDTAASFIGDSTASTVTLQWNPLFSGFATVRVAGDNHCGTTSFMQTTVNVYPVIGTPAFADTYDSVCNGTAQSYYPINPVNDATSYNWDLIPAGAGSVSVSSDTMGIITWNGSFTGEAKLSVRASNACEFTTDTLYLTVISKPSVVVALDANICNGSSTSIGGGPLANLAYSWNANPADPSLTGQETNSNPVVTPTVTTTYTLLVTDTLTTCTNAASTVVTVIPAPTVSIIANTSICSGSQLNIGGADVPGYTYDWTSEPVGFTSNISNPLVSPTVTTTYYLTVTETATTCTNSDSTVITVNPIPTLDIIADDEICEGSDISIGGAPVLNYTYSWTSAPSGFTSTEANPLVSPTVTTTYYLNVTDTTTMCSNSDSVVIDVNPMPTADIIEDTEICSGNNINIGGANITGYTYDWTSNPVGFTSTIADPLVSPTVTTTYYLTVTETATTCTNSDSVIITVSEGVIDPTTPVGQDTVVATNSPVVQYITNSANATGFIWEINPSSAATVIAGANNDTVLIQFNPLAGTVTLSVRAYNACDTSIVVSKQIEAVIGINELESIVAQIFPNPAKDKLNVAVMPETLPLSAYIYNAYGQLVKTSTLTIPETTINLTNFEKGIYTLRLVRNNQIYNYKFIIN